MYSRIMIQLKQINPPSLVSLILLGKSFFSITDGCLWSSSTKPTNQQRLDMVEGSTIISSHKLPCILDEALQTNCLNGGECFAIPSYNGLRETGCNCRSSWEGRRCELAFIDPEILAIQQRNVHTAHMAAGVSVCILVFFFILVSVYVYIKKRKTQDSIASPRKSSNAGTDPAMNKNNNRIVTGSRKKSEMFDSPTKYPQSDEYQALLTEKKNHDATVTENGASNVKTKNSTKEDSSLLHNI